MNKKANIVLGIFTGIMALVAIFVLFAYAFNDSQSLNFEGSNVFVTMFGSETLGRAAVPGLIVAFIFQCVAVLAALVAGFLPGKASSIGFGLTLVLLVTAAILYLNGVRLFEAVNPAHSDQDTKTLGLGLILTAVFSFIGGVTSLYGAYSNFKA